MIVLLLLAAMVSAITTGEYCFGLPLLSPVVLTYDERIELCSYLNTYLYEDCNATTPLVSYTPDSSGNGPSLDALISSSSASATYAVFNKTYICHTLVRRVSDVRYECYTLATNSWLTVILFTQPAATGCYPARWEYY